MCSLEDPSFLTRIVPFLSNLKRLTFVYTALRCQRCVFVASRCVIMVACSSVVKGSRREKKGANAREREKGSGIEKENCNHAGCARQGRAYSILRSTSYHQTHQFSWAQEVIASRLFTLSNMSSIIWQETTRNEIYRDFFVIQRPDNCNCAHIDIRVIHVWSIESNSR